MGSREDEKEGKGFTGETFITAEYCIPTIDLGAFKLDQAVVGLVSEDFCLIHRLIPVSRAGEKVIVAMADPADVAARDAFYEATGTTLDPVVAADADIRRAIAEHYRSR